MNNMTREQLTFKERLQGCFELFRNQGYCIATCAVILIVLTLLVVSQLEIAKVNPQLSKILDSSNATFTLDLCAPFGNMSHDMFSNKTFQMAWFWHDDVDNNDT